MVDDAGGRLPTVDELAGPVREQFGGGGEPHFDPEGPAVYIIGGSQPATILVCRPCRYVHLVLTIPRVRALTWSCPNGHGYHLSPPAAVVASGSIAIARELPKRPH